MPASDLSRISMAGAPRSDLAALMAKDIAHREVGLRIQAGLLNRHDEASIAREYRRIYEVEYYKYYAHFLSHQQKVVYVPFEKKPSMKYEFRHTAANFSRSNYLIRTQGNRIIVDRFKYPIDEDISPDTKEAFLGLWPGPLDRPDNLLKRKITGYIETLSQHDSQRRIRYCSSMDDQRKTILMLLRELLNRNGAIDAPGITRLLLRQEQTEIQKDESNRKPLETLQKYLLLGFRGEAIKFAKTRKLWDHAQCLAFLDKYQPPRTENYFKDGLRMRDDPIVQLNDEYINSMDHGILNTVYRSLLNRIIQRSDPEAINIIKHPNVNNDHYEFAILSANDCEIEFDQTNEIFKLINAIKQAVINPLTPNNHLISLGYTSLDGAFLQDDISNQSHMSFKQGDTCASRTLTISNIDMLLLNEIWEYCLNLAKGTSDPTNYDYIVDLVPYKLVFASRLLDFGLHQMFANYLGSIKNALAKAKSQQFYGADPLYDWHTIDQCVEHLNRVSEFSGLEAENAPYQALNQESLSFQPNLDYGYNPPPPATFSMHHSLPAPVVPVEPQIDYPDSSQNDYPSLPYQGEGHRLNQSAYPPMRHHNIPPPIFNQHPIQEETTDFNPESGPMSSHVDEVNNYEPLQTQNDYSNQPSRRTSAGQDVPPYSPPSFGPPGTAMSDRNPNKQMTSSSPVNRSKDTSQPNPMIGESFASPFSPINEYDDLPGRGSDVDRRPPGPPSTVTGMHDQQMASRSSGNSGNTQSNPNNNSDSQQPAGDQQSGFFTNLIGSAKGLLPKSNSKQMILPDDSSKAIVYDDKKGAWIDTTQPEDTDGNDLNDAPPMMNVTKQPTYSFATKTIRSRYPRA